MSKDQLWEKSGVPPVLRTLEFSNFRESVPLSIFKILLNFINNFDKHKPSGLYLYSADPGTGKSGLASCTQKTLIRLGKIDRCSFFVNYVDLLMEAREAYNEYSDYMESFSVVRVLDSDLVIIDEFAMQKATEFAVDFIRWLVNKLWENQRRIIFTSNISIEGLSQRLMVEGDATAANAIVSRLMSMCSLVELTTRKDFRAK